MIISDKGARLGNFLFDNFCILLLFLVCSFLIAIVSDSVQYYGTYIADFVFPGLYFTYYFTFELILNKTPGKYLTKTKVVNLKGQKPYLKALIFRTICRLTPIDIFSFVFGTGLHDNCSGTTVISSPKKTVAHEPY